IRSRRSRLELLNFTRANRLEPIDDPPSEIVSRQKARSIWQLPCGRQRGDRFAPIHSKIADPLTTIANRNRVRLWVCNLGLRQAQWPSVPVGREGSPLL